MIHIFAGPTINSEKILSILPSAVCLPPAKASSFLDLIGSPEAKPITAIVLIDGLYHSTLSVRHKEIIYALKQGIPVYGCSSMGALRASELSEVGMIGFGRIFDYYSNLLFSSDDEVAISHNAVHPYECYSIPLINIRFTLFDMVKKNLIEPVISDNLLNKFKFLHFSERTFEFINCDCEFSPYHDIIIDNYQDWKIIDAVSCLEHVKNNISNLSQTSVISSAKSNSLSEGNNPIALFVDSKYHVINNDQSNEDINSHELLNRISNDKDAELHLYNSYNRYAAILLADYLSITPCKQEIDFHICNNLKLDNVDLDDFSFTTRKGDSLFQYRLATEEAKIFKLHLFLNSLLLDISSLSPLVKYLSKMCVLRLTNSDHALSNITNYLCLLKQLEPHSTVGNFVNPFFSCGETSHLNSGRST